MNDLILVRFGYNYYNIVPIPHRSSHVCQISLTKTPFKARGGNKMDGEILKRLCVDAHSIIYSFRSHAIFNK